MKIRLIRALSIAVALAAFAFSFAYAETWLDRPLSTHVAVVLGKAADALEPLPGDSRDGMDVSLGIGTASVSQYYSTGHGFDDEANQYATQLKALDWTRSGASRLIYRKGQLCARVSVADQTHYAIEFGWRTSWCDPSGLANQTFAVAIAVAGLSQFSLAYWVTKAIAAKPMAISAEQSEQQMGAPSVQNRMRARGRYERLPAGCVMVVFPSAASLAVLMVSGIWLATNIAAFRI